MLLREIVHKTHWAQADTAVKGTRGYFVIVFCHLLCIFLFLNRLQLGFGLHRSVLRLHDRRVFTFHLPSRAHYDTLRYSAFDSPHRSVNLHKCTSTTHQNMPWSHRVGMNSFHCIRVSEDFRYIHPASTSHLFYAFSLVGNFQLYFISHHGDRRHGNAACGFVFGVC